jgi:hypothetical protein
VSAVVTPGVDISGAADAAALLPVSPLAGWDCCSLTLDSPELVDHLVTFIACEIVTGCRPYRNFRKSSEPVLAEIAGRPSIGGEHSCPEGPGPNRGIAGIIPRFVHDFGAENVFFENDLALN